MSEPLAALLKGVVIGFSIAAPVGPIGLLCIQRTTVYGRGAGFATGLGAASADAVYGSIAAFGLAAAVVFVTGIAGPVRIGGGLFLCWLGISAARTRTVSPAISGKSPSGLPGAFFSAFVLTLSNPMTIISFAGVFAGLGAAGASGGTAVPAALVTGVFTGSLVWWVILSGTAAAAKNFLGGRSLGYVNRISGAVIFGFGLWSLISVYIKGS